MYFDLDDNYDRESDVLRSFVGNRGGMVICFETALLNILFSLRLIITTTNNNTKSDGGTKRYRTRIYQMMLLLSTEVERTGMIV